MPFPPLWKVWKTPPAPPAAFPTPPTAPTAASIGNHPQILRRKLLRRPSGQKEINWADPHIDGVRLAGHWRDYLGYVDVEGRLRRTNMHARSYGPTIGRFLSIDPVLVEQVAYLHLVGVTIRVKHSQATERGHDARLPPA